jgi:hypothetical protein
LQTRPETRRSVLLYAGALAAASTVPHILPGTARAQQNRRRKSIEALTPTELDAYERAIQTVKTRSDANPDDNTGYLYWASLHNDFDTPHSGCAHFSEKFFPWHRRHLFDFEKVLQQTIPGVTDNVMIPYWDWIKPPQQGQHFPSAFEREASPLFNRRFNLTPPPWDAEEVRRMVKDPDWSLFAGLPDPSDGFGESPGSVESGPHNTLHTNISRNMRSPSTAALDPIFWSFHAYIDVIWSRWQRLHVTDQNPQPFRDGAAIIWFRDRSFEVRTTAKTSDFGYEYDYDYSPDGPAAPPVVLGAAPTVSVYSPPARTVPLQATNESGRYFTLRPAGHLMAASNSVLRIGSATVFRDKSYRLTLYLHPSNVEVAAIGAQARGPMVIRRLTVWRTHHGGRVQLLVKLTPGQVAQLNSGWVITIASEIALAEEDVQLLTTAPSPAFVLPATSSLAHQVEIQER